MWAGHRLLCLGHDEGGFVLAAEEQLLSESFSLGGGLHSIWVWGEGIFPAYLLHCNLASSPVIVSYSSLLTCFISRIVPYMCCFTLASDRMLRTVNT